MLARSDVKTPLIVLLVFSLIAELCLLAGIIQSAIGGYIGLLMQQSSFTPCSNYLKFKVETLNTYMFNIIFFCACGAAVVSIAFLIVLARLIIKVRENENQQFPEFTLKTFYLLYIVYSIAILLAIPGAGFYLTLIIQKGNACLGSYQLYWLTIGGVFILALFFLLICWVYLLILKLRLQDKFQEKQEKKPLIPQTLIKIPQQTTVQPSIGNILDLILMQQRLKDNQQHKTQLKQPLVAEVDSDDQASLEQGEKEKIACVDYGQYKRKQQAIKKKEEQDQRLIQELIALEIAKRKQIERQEAEKKAKEKQKKKLLNMALSPNDEGFDKIFQQSEKQEHQELNNNQNSPRPQKGSPSNSQKSALLQQPFYPANYVPINEQDQKKFKQYKKKLLQKYNIQKPKKEKRHLQNIDGGRSRRQLLRALNAHKKPPRTVQYYENLLKNSNVTPIQEIKNSETYSSQQEDKQSILVNSKQHQNRLKPQQQQTPQVREQPSMMAPDFIQPRLTDRDYDAEEKTTNGILLFEKRADKSPMRKKLFDQEASYLKSMSMGSVLGTLVKGVVQSSHHSRLMRLREQKNADKDPFYIKRRKNEKIIDFIRSKYS